MSEASYNKLFGTAGGMAGGAALIRYIKRSQTFVAPFASTLDVFLVAGHGGGAAAAGLTEGGLAAVVAAAWGGWCKVAG